MSDSTALEPPPAAVPAAERGRTSISHTAVASVVSHAALEVDGARGLRRRRGAPERAQTAVDLDRAVATVELGLAVVYPRPVRTVAAAVREHLRVRVAELCGIEVARVTIRVEALRRTTDPYGRPA